jgi:uncharacterized protein (DUF58 family)
MNAPRRIVLLLLAFSLLAAVIWGNQIYYRLTYLWAFVLAGTWLWSSLSMRGLSVSRSARTLRAQVGQVFEERFEVSNQSRIPKLWLEVHDGSSLPGSKGSRVLTLIESRGGRSYYARTRLAKRGVYPLGPTSVSTGDLWGIFSAQSSEPATVSLLVYPMLVEINAFPNPPGLLPGGEALRRRTHQVTPNAYGVRDYAPGDPLNRIHWASTARRDRFMVKEFELDPLADVWIFLDAAQLVQATRDEPEQQYDLDIFWRSGGKAPLAPSTEEYGVVIAASLAHYYLRQRRSVGFITAGQHLALLPPDRGPRQLGKILEALALLQCQGQIPLRALVETQSRHMPRGSTVVLITPMGDEELVGIADFLVRRGMRPVVVWLNAETFGGHSPSEQLLEKLSALSIPIRHVTHGANLEAVLSAGAKPTVAPVNVL